MPELPEVETVRKGLSRLVLNKVIESVDVFWPRIIERPEVEEFKMLLVGQKIERVDRRGKFLIFKLTNFDLISHLRMEGKYEFTPTQKEESPSKHVHVIFHFSDQSQLAYNDVRKFGRMALVPKNQSHDYKGIRLLGVEPVAPDFQVEVFYQQLTKSSMAIKPLLLGQKVVVGLGNIYVDEALWQAKIHPETRANSLTYEEAQHLHEAIIEVLAKAVEAGGTTIRSYVGALGEVGTFQVALNAYGQTNEPCPRCLTPIEKIKVAQRGTHFCPKCQIRKG
ncbi:DNA-formamidopyrimidine glycosylase [Enterococcus lemanii]|uniref:Formamidopyrimidine-DNA glycosylase n=1 Tax=Enterococcus lemanii TaxID=1159752 RepID=A0ABV9MVN5_9ENTE|nr:DNA-formamidopyrimidine glycosylase [Enterococcus lemanii]MBM7708678.1 formamidopyrimidine-DNA glycosylase [Enterococcus lemanii]